MQLYIVIGYRACWRNDLTALSTLLGDIGLSRCARSLHANGRWGWRPCRGKRVPGYPSTDTPRTRDPNFVWPGATRRCFALLGLSRRGAMRLCGERLWSVRVVVGGLIGRRSVGWARGWRLVRGCWRAVPLALCCERRGALCGRACADAFAPVCPEGQCHWL